MFRFFRHIRLKLFNEGKASRYLGYAVGEIVLIVVGILIALEIGDMNQARKDRVEETAILVRLKAEFEDNQAEILDSELVEGLRC